VADSGKGFVVDTIIDHRLHHGELQLRIQWENLPDEQSSWEPFCSVCQTASPTVRQYIRLVQNKSEQADLLAAFNKAIRKK
jgi:hypothetical protein